VKNEDLITNLETGILFEDNGEFLRWNDSFKDIEKHCKEVEVKGDRVVYHLGEHKILNGLTCHLSSMRWINESENNPFSSIDYFLGFDAIAIDKIEFLSKHLKHELGKPSKEEDWDNDEMLQEWNFDKTHITLSTWERFAIHGKMNVGLVSREHLNGNTKKKTSKNIIHGVLQVVLACLWLYQTINLFIRYQNPNIDFFMRYPDWVIFTKIVLGISAVFVGFSVILKKIPVKFGYILSLGTIIVGELFYEIITFFN
jgi:hypothetical protein